MSNLLYFNGLGAVSSLFLSGTYFSASQLTIPTLYGHNPAFTTAVFAKLYHRGTVAIVPQVVLSTACSAYLAYAIPAQRSTHLIGALAPFATLPFTTLVMMGTIQKLLGLAEEESVRNKVGTQGVDGLLSKWAGMNMMRSAMAFVGGLASLWAIVEQLGALRTL